MKKRSGVLRELLDPVCFFKKDVKNKKIMKPGEYGLSSTGQYGSNDRKIVIKQLYSLETDPARMEYIQAELALLTQAKGKFLLTPIGFCFSKPITIATDYMNRGSLYDLIHGDKMNKKLMSTQKTLIAMGVAYGMRRLHKKRIIHGDLKSTNVLIGNDGYPLISDFGLVFIAQRYSSQIKSKNEHPYWWAPELFEKDLVTEASDIYAFGILLYEMLNNSVPFESMSKAEINNAIHDPNMVLPIPEGTPRMLSCLIQSCLNSNPQQRPSFKRIYRLFKNHHAFFPGTDSRSINTMTNQINRMHHKYASKVKPLTGIPTPPREEFKKYFEHAREDLKNLEQAQSIRVRYLHLPKHIEGRRKARDLALVKPGMIFPMPIKEPDVISIALTKELLSKSVYTNKYQQWPSIPTPEKKAAVYNSQGSIPRSYKAKLELPQRKKQHVESQAAKEVPLPLSASSFRGIHPGKHDQKLGIDGAAAMLALGGKNSIGLGKLASAKGWGLKGLIEVEAK